MNYGGGIRAVYGEAATTLADFKELEPSNGMGLAMNAGDADEALYALFFRGGGFTTEAPIINEWPEGTAEAEFSAGRVVVDDLGDVVNLQLWQVEKSAAQPFGTPHDDH